MDKDSESSLEEAIRAEFARSTGESSPAAPAAPPTPADADPLSSLVNQKSAPASEDEQIRKGVSEHLNNADEANVQEVERKAEEEEKKKRKQEEESKSPALKHAEDVYGNVKNKVMSLDVPQILGSGTAALASGLNQGFRVDDLETNKENEKKLFELKKDLKDAPQPYSDTISELKRQHAIQGMNLLDDQWVAHQNALESQDALERANAEHEKHMAVDVDKLLGNKPAPAVEPVEGLTRTPVGGKATFNYALSYGAPEAEAMTVASPSKVQGNIPTRAENEARATGVDPRFQKFNESELFLSPEGQKAKVDLMNQGIKQQNQQAGLRSQMIKDLGERQQQTKLARDQAEKLHNQNLDLLHKVNQQIEQHAKTNPVSPERQALANREKYDLQKQLDWMREYEGGNKATRAMSLIGRKIVPRFAPELAAAASVEQAAEAKRAYEAGDYPRAAAYGLGVLGDVGLQFPHPWAKGLGALAQIPAIAAYEAPELWSEPKPGLPAKP